MSPFKATESDTAGPRFGFQIWFLDLVWTLDSLDGNQALESRRSKSHRSRMMADARQQGTSDDLFYLDEVQRLFGDATGTTD